jgi:hypothetical protein
MLSAFFDWVGDLALVIAQAVGQSLAVRLNKGTDQWWHTVIKFCVFAIIYPALVIGILLGPLLLFGFIFKIIFWGFGV